MLRFANLQERRPTLQPCSGLRGFWGFWEWKFSTKQGESILWKSPILFRLPSVQGRLFFQPHKDALQFAFQLTKDLFCYSIIRSGCELSDLILQQFVFLSFYSQFALQQAHSLLKLVKLHLLATTEQRISQQLGSCWSNFVSWMKHWLMDTSVSRNIAVNVGLFTFNKSENATEYPVGSSTLPSLISFHSGPREGSRLPKA